MRLPVGVHDGFSSLALRYRVCSDIGPGCHRSLQSSPSPAEWSRSLRFASVEACYDWQRSRVEEQRDSRPSSTQFDDRRVPQGAKLLADKLLDPMVRREVEREVERLSHPITPLGNSKLGRRILTKAGDPCGCAQVKPLVGSM
jgi:hypothetical protein